MRCVRVYVPNDDDKACGRYWFCTKCHRKQPGKKPIKFPTHPEGRWCRRLVATSNTVGKGVDVVIPGVYGECTFIYWRVLRMLVHVGIQTLLRTPRLLVLFTFLYQDWIHDSETISPDIMNQGLNFDKMKRWILEHFQKHAEFFDNLMEVERGPLDQNIMFCGLRIREFFDPSPLNIQATLKLMVDKQQQCTVCIINFALPTRINVVFVVFCRNSKISHVQQLVLFNFMKRQSMSIRYHVA